MSDRPTPRTDAAAYKVYEGPHHSPTIHHVVEIDDARGLERELAEANERLDALLECLEHLQERDWFREGVTGGVVCGLDANKVRNAIALAKGDKP